MKIKLLLLTAIMLSCGMTPAFAQGVPPPPPLPPGSFVLARAIDKHGEEHVVRPPVEPPPAPAPAPDISQAMEAAIILDQRNKLNVVPQSDAKAFECNTTTAGTKAFSISFPTYPCIMQTTYEALDRSYEVDKDGKRKRGFWTGKVPRTFLRIRLVTRGIFSALAGLVGLG